MKINLFAAGIVTLMGGYNFAEASTLEQTGANAGPLTQAQIDTDSALETQPFWDNWFCCGGRDEGSDDEDSDDEDFSFGTTAAGKKYCTPEDYKKCDEHKKKNTFKVANNKLSSSPKPKTTSVKDGAAGGISASASASAGFGGINVTSTSDGAAGGISSSVTRDGAAGNISASGTSDGAAGGISASKIVPSYWDDKDLDRNWGEIFPCCVRGGKKTGCTAKDYEKCDAIKREYDNVDVDKIRARASKSKTTTVKDGAAGSSASVTRDGAAGGITASKTVDGAAVSNASKNVDGAAVSHASKTVDGAAVSNASKTVDGAAGGISSKKAATKPPADESMVQRMIREKEECIAASNATNAKTASQFDKMKDNEKACANLAYKNNSSA